MPEKSEIVKKARGFVESKSMTYRQFRGKGWLEDAFMDCSEFVYQSYKQAGFVEFNLTNTSLMRQGMTVVTEPEAGDVVYWPGHVGIVADPDTGEFLHAASTNSGLRKDNYKSGYWASHSGRVFLRYGK